MQEMHVSFNVFFKRNLLTMASVGMDMASRGDVAKELLDHACSRIVKEIEEDTDFVIILNAKDRNGRVPCKRHKNFTDEDQNEFMRVTAYGGEAEIDYLIGSSVQRAAVDVKKATSGAWSSLCNLASGMKEAAVAKMEGMQKEAGKMVDFVTRDHMQDYADRFK
ncbi:hypothetical protein [Flaviaesturariibacter amylovorans]|uniref:Uncharacterized protein n=1 Tax=Flaviaesturariibacter amylovorans TaxID=1084520 RepID=A0ABP8HRB4_9BACT